MSFLYGPYCAHIMHDHVICIQVVSLYFNYIVNILLYHLKMNNVRNLIQFQKLIQRISVIHHLYINLILFLNDVGLEYF